MNKPKEPSVTPAKCVVCGGEIAEQWSDDSHVGMGAVVLERCWCRNCGLLYRFPPNTREAR